MNTEDHPVMDHPVMEHTSKLGDHGARISKIEDSDEKQWTAINNLRNRLPAWATAIISALTFTVGVLTGIILEMGRMIAR